MIPECPQRLGVLVVIGDDKAAFASATEVFTRIEAETTEVADRSEAAAAVASADRLGDILDDRQAVTTGKLHGR
ncbi:hypothetical protein D3C87_2149350 [compost metagenome]